MKKMRFFAMLTMAATMIFTFNSCDKDDDGDDFVVNTGGYNQTWVNEFTDNGVLFSFGELFDDGSTLSYAMKSEKKRNWVVYKDFYTYDKSGIITNMTMDAECSSEEYADELENNLKEMEMNNGIKSYERSGVKFKAVYGDEYFSGYTKDDVLEEYEDRIRG